MGERRRARCEVFFLPLAIRTTLPLRAGGPDGNCIVDEEDAPSPHPRHAAANRREKAVLMRGMRALCAKNCRQLWLGCYQMDSSTPKKRAGFLSTIRRRMARVA